MNCWRCDDTGIVRENMGAAAGEICDCEAALVHRLREAERAVIVEAIATYCDELGIKVFIDESGPAVWLGDRLRAGDWTHRLAEARRTLKAS
jgi:hypothetical protein